MVDRKEKPEGWYGYPHDTKHFYLKGADNPLCGIEQRPIGATLRPQWTGSAKSNQCVSCWGVARRHVMEKQAASV